MKNKIFISGILVFCLGIAAIFQSNLLAMVDTSSEEDIAMEEDMQAKQPEKQQKSRLTSIPFNDATKILNDSAVKFVLKGIKLDFLNDTIDALSVLFKALEQFEKDAVAAQQAKDRLAAMAVCSQKKQKVRQTISQCKAVKCGAGRSACLRESIKVLKVVLKPFIVDGFIGYKQKDGKQMEGLASLVFDVVQQGGVKEQFNRDVTQSLIKVMRVLDVLEKSIKTKKTILANQGM